MPDSEEKDFQYVAYRLSNDDFDKRVKNIIPPSKSLSAFMKDMAFEGIDSVTQEADQRRIFEKKIINEVNANNLQNRETIKTLVQMVEKKFAEIDDKMSRMAGSIADSVTILLEDKINEAVQVGAGQSLVLKPKEAAVRSQGAPSEDAITRLSKQVKYIAETLVLIKRQGFIAQLGNKINEDKLLGKE